MNRWPLSSIACLVLVALVSRGAAADERLEGVASLVFSGKAAEARPRLESALAIYKADDNAAGEGVVLVLLGLTDLAERNSEAARANLTSGAARLREAGDVFSATIALWAAINVDAADGRIEAALAGYERALGMLADAADPRSPFTLDGFRILAPAMGMDPAMLGPLLLSPEILKPILLSAAEAMLRDGYGAALTEAGKFDEAERELTRARSAGAIFGGMFDSSIEAHFGNLRRRQWRFEEARAHYRKALDDLKPMPMIPAYDDVMNLRMFGHLAEIEFLGGNTDEALHWFDKALARVRPMNLRKEESSLLEDRASLLMRAGRFADAEKTYRQALAIAEKIGSLERQATILSSLGSLQFFRGELGTAATTLEKSLGLFGKVDLKESEAATWLSLAEVYLTLNARGTAREALGRARALARESDFRLASELVEVVASADRWMSGSGSPAEVDRYLGKWWELPEAGDLMLPEELRVLMRGIVGLDGDSDPDPQKLGTLAMAPMAYLLRGKKLFLQGDVAGARALWNKALAENENRDLRPGYLSAIGATHWKEGNEEEAIRYFDGAVAALGLAAEHVKVEETLAGYLGSERRWYFEVVIEALVRKGRYEEAFDHSERSRARAFLHSLGNARLQPARGGSPELVREAEALRKSIAEWERDSAFRSEQTATDLRNARRQYQSLLERVKVSNPEYASLTTVKPMRIADVQRTIPAGTTLVSFFVSPRRVHAWVVDRELMRYVPLKVNAAQLEKAACWAAGLGGTAGAVRSMQPAEGGCAAAASAEDVYDLLVAPLRPAVRNDRLILVPHGVLHYVPFAAVRDSKSGRRLIEDFTITYAPSASALRFLADKETPAGGRALIIGDPATKSAARERLSGAHREAMTIGSAMGASPALGAEAKESLLYNLGGRYDLVHIGAHAEYNATEPIFSRIALAPDGARDGNLEVHEILSDVDLSGVNLVVLSACGTARGVRSGGDEIVGLTRAVLYAGATGVVSTLWDIDDEAAADLMEVFYRRILAGTSAADALRDAQLATMRRASYADPKFWAAFQLSGNPEGRWSTATTAGTH